MKHDIELIDELPAGTYEAAIHSLPKVETRGEKEWEYFLIEFQIISGEHEGCCVTFSAPFHPKAKSTTKLGHFLKVMFPEHSSGKYSFEEMLQKTCEIRCEINEKGYPEITPMRLLGSDNTAN